MLDQIVDAEVIDVGSYPLTVPDYAMALFARVGTTVMVTHEGDAPIVPLRFRDIARNVDIIARTATDEDLEKLMEIPQMRKRFQILESVPYTDIIIGDEVPTTDTLALRAKQKENLKEGAHIFGTVAYVTLRAVFTVAVYAVSLVFVAARDAVCGTDPIVWARLETGEWLEIARFYK
jgi:hypothetical protein